MGTDNSISAKGKTDRLSILSVGDAHMQAMQTVDKVRLTEIAFEVINRDEVKGNADDYHNLAVVYTREWDDYVSGYGIVKKGLLQYPSNIDLLADAIFYGSSAGRYKECEEHERALSIIPVSVWNWRAFSFLIDYYLDKLDWIKWSEKTEDDTDKIVQQQLEKALRYAKLEQKILYGSEEVERGYLAENKVRLMREKVLRANAALLELDGKDVGQIDQLNRQAEEEHRQAEDILQSAIDNGKFAATSCCLRLADIRFERQEYNETIKVCEKALQFVQSQPSVNTAYFTYLIALSRDALIHKDGCYENEIRIREVYQDYKCAFEMNSYRSGREVYLRNIQDRVAILEAKTGFVAPSLKDTAETPASTFAELLKKFKS